MTGYSSCWELRLQWAISTRAHPSGRKYLLLIVQSSQPADLRCKPCNAKEHWSLVDTSRVDEVLSLQAAIANVSFSQQRYLHPEHRPVMYQLQAVLYEWSAEAAGQSVVLQCTNFLRLSKLLTFVHTVPHHDSMLQHFVDISVYRTSRIDRTFVDEPCLTAHGFVPS